MENIKWMSFDEYQARRNFEKERFKRYDMNITEEQYKEDGPPSVKVKLSKEIIEFIKTTYNVHKLYNVTYYTPTFFYVEDEDCKENEFNEIKL